MSSDVSAGVHVFVAQTGVGVVDAKACKGKLVRREVGPLWRRDNEVFVGGRNQTKLATGVQRQVNAVIAALRPDSTLHRIDIHGALCLLDAELALLDFPFQIGNTWVRLKSRPVSRETMARIARRPQTGPRTHSHSSHLSPRVMCRNTTIDVWRAPALLSFAFDFGPPRRLAMKALSNVGVVFVRAVRAFSVDFT